jgi:hypothetical protein
MKESKKKIEWVEVCGTKVPKHQLEAARKELNSLMDDHETQYLRMQEEIKDPDKKFDVHTLLYWKQVFNNDGKLKLAQLASDKVEEILEQNLKEDLSWESSFNVAMIYGRDLGMPEKTIELMDNIVASGDFAQSVAVAELYVAALGDRMVAGEYYRQAEKMIKDLKERCLLAQSVADYFDKEWSDNIYRHHVERELEYPCFDTLFPIIEILEDLDQDLADQGIEALIKLSKSDKNRLKQLLTKTWAYPYEKEIKTMLQ